MHEPDRRAVPTGPRDLPDGISFMPASAGDAENAHKRLKVLETELDQVQNELKHYKEIYTRERSNWRIAETKLLQDNRDLQEQIKLLKRELADTGTILEGTPNLLKESHSSSEGPAIKYMQRIVPQLRSYKSRILELNSKLSNQRNIIYGLTRLFESKIKGVQEYRRLVASSLDSTSSPSSAPLGTGTNMNLTLSLASQQNISRGSFDRHMVHHPAMETDRYPRYTTETSEGGVRFDRHGPVERSDHEYGNAEEFYRTAPQTLTSETASRITDAGTSTTKRSVKTPIPMPRVRSLRPVPKAPTGVEESMLAESYEIVDRPTNRQLGMISENSPSSAGSAQSGTLNHPRMLNQNVSTAPYAELGQGSNDISSTRSHHSAQVCDVCRKGFPELTRRKFEDHCIDCAERAAEEEAGAVTVATPVSNADQQTCPVCFHAFGHELSQIDFENHVQSHFAENEAQAQGWEQVTTD